MFGKKNKKGFTLIEMLVVIAIIAVLVAVIIPTVTSSTTKAQAATDAANLRSVLGVLNMDVLAGNKTVDAVIADVAHPTSKYDPDATLRVVYKYPGFIDVYYVDEAENQYYGLEYLSELAANGPNSAALATIGTARPAVEGTWYEAGEGEVTP